MNQTLKIWQFELLKEVVSKHCPELSKRIELPDISNLFQGERLVIIDALSGELMASGINKDSEPTQRGLLLEELIDVVNSPNLQKLD